MKAITTSKIKAASISKVEMASMPPRKTYSVCPVCLKRIPAKLVHRDGNWYMEKVCEQHGEYKTVVWRGSAPALTGWGSYNPPKENEEELPDCPKDCGLCAGHLQSTCCVLVEVTDRCNLRCPVCFAQSGDPVCSAQSGDPVRFAQSGEDVPAPEKSVEELYKDFLFLVDKGCKFIQLSGGEPTVRDDLPKIVRAAKKAGATSVQLNSNGLRLGKEPEFTKLLAEAGLDFVFMQFDGLDDSVYCTLRGKPLFADKLEAIRVCSDAGIGVTLVPTVVPGVNDHQIGAIVKFGIEHSPNVRGVHFQPVSYFGRYPAPPSDESRITLPEIISAIERQTEGLIKMTDLAPSCCDHPRCGFHGDFVIMQDKLVSLLPKSPAQSDGCCCGEPSRNSESRSSGQGAHNRLNDEALRNRNFVARRWKRNLSLEQEAAEHNASAGSCCCDGSDRDTVSEDAMDFDTFLAKVAANGFTVTGMAFQDAYNLDIERLRRCSLHVYEDGLIIPFCARYLTSI